MSKFSILLLAGTALSSPGLAQESEPEALADDTTAPTTAPVSGRDFTPADFERFSPNTALDMVRQIPGFAIQQGDDRRGLGQGGDNVLINGERVSGKSNDAVTTLRRISAADVVRIELRDAASLDIPGLSGQVVNIIAETTGVSGSFAWNPQFRARITAPRLYNGEISVSGTLGAFDYTLGLANTSDSFRGGGEGIEQVFDGAGNLVDTRYEVVRFTGDRPQATAGLRYDGPGSSVGNINLSYERRYFVGREESERSGIGQPDRQRNFRDTEREWNFEIGGDFEFALGPGRLKLIGLRRFEHSPFVTRVMTQFVDGSPTTGTRFERMLDEGEWIGRSEYSWQMGGDWQVALEGALNTLDIESRLFTLDTAGDFQPVGIPGAAAQVEERRAEANVTYGRQLAEGLTVQASLGGEYSQLSQTGANGLTRTFYRPKGFLSLAWAVNDSLDLRLRFEREVGQLNFSDFVASRDINNSNQDAGNPNLVPPQSWNYEFEATKNLGDYGSITARLYYEQINDIVDQVPIGLTGEAPGNIDSARRYGIEWNSTFNFDPIGWRGARLDVEFTLQGSSLTDPLTGLSRPISEDLERDVEIELRHDIPGTQWAWGLEYENFAQSDGFRLGQIADFRLRAPSIGAYIEHKNVFGLRVRGGVYNIIDRADNFTRTAFVDRRTGPIDIIEDRSRTFGPIFSFQVSGSF